MKMNAYIAIRFASAMVALTEWFRCDRCGEEEKLYEFDGRQLCKDCVISLLDEVEVD